MTRAQADVGVGLVFPCSGRYAALGAHLVRACEIALATAIARDVPRAERVRLIAVDAVDAETARTAVASLAAQGVVAIVGSELSDVAVSAAREAHARGLLFWEVEAIIDELTAERRQGIFRFNCDASSFGATPVDFVAELLAPAAEREPRSLRLGILREDTPYARSTAAGALRRARELGLDVRAEETVAPRADVASAVRRCAAAGVEVLLSSGYSDHAIATFDAVRMSGLRLLALVGAGAGYNTDRFAEHAGAGAEAVYVTGNAPSTALDERRLAPSSRELLARYRVAAAASGMPARDADLELAFQGTLLLLEGVIGPAETTALADLDAAARAIDVPDGQTVVGFGLRFGPTGQNERGRPAVMRRIGGVMRALFPPVFAVPGVAEHANAG